MVTEMQSAGNKPQIGSLQQIGAIVVLLLGAVLAMMTEAQQRLDTSVQITHCRIEIPPIVLARDDKPAFPVLPDNFKSLRAGIEHGKVDTLSYPSHPVGTRRKTLIDTPPGSSASQTYLVVFLLHGIRGEEMEWFDYGAAQHVILDNLLADHKIVPSIVISPNGRAKLNDHAEGDAFRHASSFATFQYDLLDDLPYVESHYPVSTNRIHRALAGFSNSSGHPGRVNFCRPRCTSVLEQAAGGSRLACECRRTYHVGMGT